jgi:transcriptional regulator with XRE-family HTH domain
VPKKRSAALHRALVALLITERRRAGLQQGEVAARVGEDQSWLSSIETGRRKRVDVVEFIALAMAIGFDPAKAVRKLLQSRSRPSRS